MFRKRSLNISVVEEPKSKTKGNEQIPECNHLDSEKIQDLIQTQIKYAATAVIAVAGALTLFHTVSEIVINATKPKDQK